MAEYDPTIAFGLAQYSNLAYCRKGALKKHFEDPASDFKFLEGEADGVDTQGFMVTHGEGVILAFRGTQQVVDLATDLWFGPTYHAAAPSSRVHKGFRRAYEEVRTKMLEEIDRRHPSRVFVTGHSLGGAIATFAALDIAQEDDNISVTMYNFGSPRVGDLGFATFYNEHVDDSFRVVAPGDPVTELPSRVSWPVAYRHVNHERPLGCVPWPLFDHDLASSYLPRLSVATSGQSFFG